MGHWNVLNSVTDIDVHSGSGQSIKPGHPWKSFQTIRNSDETRGWLTSFSRVRSDLSVAFAGQIDQGLQEPTLQEWSAYIPLVNRPIPGPHFRSHRVSLALLTENLKCIDGLIVQDRKSLVVAFAKHILNQPLLADFLEPVFAPVRPLDKHSIA